MKRVMNLNNEDTASDDTLSHALTAFTKRNKLSKINLVSECGKLAEKVEPGYLVKLAEDIEKANDFVFYSACDKLKLIEDQMKVLKQQALQILIETRINSVLHSLPCNFQKKAGCTYSVYRKSNGECYFSMLSPEEWGIHGIPTLHEYVGSFKLEGGLTWTPVDKFSSSSALQHWIQRDDEKMMIE